MKWLREAVRSVRIDKCDVPSDKDDELPKAARGGSPSWYRIQREGMLCDAYAYIPVRPCILWYRLCWPFFVRYGGCGVQLLWPLLTCAWHFLCPSLCSSRWEGIRTIRGNLRYVCHPRNRTYLRTWYYMVSAVTAAAVFRERTELLLRSHSGARLKNTAVVLEAIVVQAMQSYMTAAA